MWNLKISRKIPLVIGEKDEERIFSNKGYFVDSEKTLFHSLTEETVSHLTFNGLFRSGEFYIVEDMKVIKDKIYYLVCRRGSPAKFLIEY